ncbi:MAG: hypothetical protein H7Z37_18980, partial [Pyrinomonadaceae bacterium]|nr:hypothetical protein [Pyrinomonadaceae bacterium]
RLLKDADVESHLCSCRSAEICRHKIAAILAFRRENNVEFSTDSIDKGELAFKLSESQTKVLGKTINLFAEFVEIGASHLSESSVERLQTLATSAGGASLFRLSFALKSLADGLQLSLNRSAQSDETSWLMFLAKTHALASSLLASNVPNKQFVGTSRTVYDEIGALEIAGIGAYQWQTLSGFHGVSVLFWDNKGKRFFSWTDARPKSDATFAPYSAFCGEMRWQGVSSPSQAAISNLKLQNAANNSQNRLSGSGQIQGFVLSATDVEKLDFGANDFSNWNDIRRYFAKIYPRGLRERESFKEFAVVRPKRFGNRHFDSTTQTFVWEIFDGDENAIDIRLKFDEYNETAIQMLEKLDLRHDEIRGIVARLATGANGLYLQPISLFVKAKSDFFSKLFKKDDDSIRVVHLNLSAKSDKHDKKVDVKNVAADENAIDEDDALEGLNAKGEIPQKLLAVRETLQNLAERGTNSIPATAFESLTQIAESLKIAGLSSVAAPISDFTRLPRNELSANLLKLVFLVELSLEIAQTNR